MESIGLKKFLKTVGGAVYSVNTAIVGLHGVAIGKAKKPKDLTIEWEAKNPKAAASQARRFVVRSALVYVVEALNEYVRYLSSCSNQSESIRKISSIEGTSNRVIELSKHVPNLIEYYPIMIVLLVRWRNKIVHNSSTSLSDEQKKVLISNKEVINEAHSNIDIEMTLENFEVKKITLKDFTTLIAITIKSIRYIDKILEPKLDDVESFCRELSDRDLIGEFKNVVGVNGKSKQQSKFHNFIRSNFPSLIGGVAEMLFESRFVVIGHLKNQE